MKLSALAEETSCARDWLILEPGKVLQCLLEAARYYAAYGDIASLSGLSERPGAPGAGETAAEPPAVPVDGIPEAYPLRDIGLIKENTYLSTGEWAIIRPLFMAYLERDRAQLLELSRSAAVEPAGRSVSEIAQDIDKIEQQVQEQAFNAAILTI